MTITPTFVMENPAGVAAEIVTQLQALATEALSRWSAVLAGDANLSVRITIQNSIPSGRAEGGWGNGVFLMARNGANLFEGAPSNELRTGTNVSGSSHDLVMNFQASYLLNELFLDSTPSTSNDIPNDKTDALSVLIHEFGHGLGFIGYWQEATNTFSSGANTPYDTRLSLIGGEAFFDGPNVRALTGGPVVLTDNNYAHYGNSNAFPGPGADPVTGLMNGVVFYRGHRYSISDLDLAFIADTGIGTTRNDIFDQTYLDVLRGGAGTDVFRGDYSAGASAMTVSLASLGQGPTVVGATTLHDIERVELTLTAFNDTLNGSAAADIAAGGGGADTLHGLGGADQLSGGGGDDQLYGGADGDGLNGGEGFDYARYDNAGAGLTAHLALPNLNTGEASGDTYSAIEGIVGTAFADVLAGDSAANYIYGGDGFDQIYGAPGDDFLFTDGGPLNFLWGDLGADGLVGGAGLDFARYDYAAAGVTADLLFSASNAGEATGDTFSSIEGLVGSTLGDLLAGDDNNTEIYGLTGADQIYGRGGSDLLFGDAGDDQIDGGAGADLLHGGEGFDFARFDFAAAAVTVHLLYPHVNTGEAAGDGYISIEGLVGSAFGDFLAGDGADNTIYGGGGNDSLYGLGGADTLYGGGGSDSFVFLLGDSSVEVRDSIVDFATGSDRIDLTNLRFSGADSLAVYDRGGGLYQINHDRGGDGSVETSILVNGLVTGADILV